MNLGIRLHDVPGSTLEARAQSALAEGFTCVHLALSKAVSPMLMDPAAATPGLAAAVTRSLHGLDVAVLGCYLNLAHPDEEEYRHMVDQYTAHLKLCRWLGAGCVGTETGNPNAACRYDPAVSHSEEALQLFIRRLRPVVDAAEKLGATLALEPVYTHIVSTPRRARAVLDTFHSPCLQIILDPVNLLHPDNLARRGEVIDEALDLLGESTIVIHLKDYVPSDNGLTAVAYGTGEMDDSAVMRYAATRKPHIQMTLENTAPATVAAAREAALISFSQAMTTGD